jgi:hypothetical protein
MEQTVLPAIFRSYKNSSALVISMRLWPSKIGHRYDVLLMAEPEQPPNLDPDVSF